MLKPFQIAIFVTLFTFVLPKHYSSESPEIKVCTDSNLNGKCKFHKVKNLNECQNLPPDINDTITSVQTQACFIFYKDPDCKGHGTFVHALGECNKQDPNCCPEYDLAYCYGFNDAISSLIRCNYSDL
uniref:Domain of unknown function DB domain-containing protein n=1 Tax=Panagrellus redivivus TaxID=6233 RepID=A0A7E4VV66_PANRE